MQRATKRRFLTSDELLRDWYLTRWQIGDRLKEYYRACTTEDLPPRLLALIKKLDQEVPDD